jgi:hypothetical protein
MNLTGCLDAYLDEKPNVFGNEDIHLTISILNKLLIILSVRTFLFETLRKNYIFFGPF